MKRVHYNGHTESQKSCQPYSDLVGANARWGIGYEVIEEVELDSQTNYVLNGVPMTDSEVNPGYNSNWFKEVPVYIANAHSVPRVGETLGEIHIIDGEGNQLKSMCEEKVISVHSLSKNVYEIYTQNSTYIIQVVK